MFKFAISLALILTNTVAAQASSLPGVVQIQTTKWVTTYKGETEVDGLPVFVNLDVAEHDLGIHQSMVGGNSFAQAQADFGEELGNVRVPFGEVKSRAYRLTFIVSHNPRIQTTYKIEPRTVSLDGAIRQAFISEFDSKRDFQFVVTAQEDSSMLVTFTRRLATGEEAQGRIVLAPLARTLR